MANTFQKILGMRERRRIYEDAICIVSQVDKMQETYPENAKKVMLRMMKKQLTKAMEIIVTTLGYHENTTRDTEGCPHTIFLPEDDDASYGIEKEKMEKILVQLPKNKELKESLWKSCVKRDKKATDMFRSLVA